MFDVISLGTATFDVFLRSAGMEVEQEGGEKDICVRYGAKLEVNEIYFDYGGGGTNSAVTFARQGLKSAAVVQVGDDFYGDKIKKDLRAEGVDVSLINTQKGYTDYSTILWAPDGGRTILVYRGKTKLELSDIPWEKLESNWFYVSSLEGNLDILEKLVGRAGAKVSFNPGQRELIQKQKLLSLLDKIVLLNLNKEEMMQLVEDQKDREGNVSLSDQPADKDRKDDEGLRSLLKKASLLPCENVVITDDRRGAYLWSKKRQVWYHSGIFENSPRFETTGAGDGFGSGLVTGFIKGFPLEESLYLAASNASSVVSQVGAKKGILSEKDLAGWGRNKLKIEELSL